MNTTIFEAEGLTKQYGSANALQNINMQIKQGDIYGFVGENGAGKTTLMKIISGLVYPTKGTIQLMGKSSEKDIARVRKKMGVLIELPALYPHMNAEENLSFYCKIHGISDLNRIKDVLNLVGLTDVENKNTSEYSLGMRQRLGLAISLLNEPEFLVLDEPINGLDPAGIVEMRKLLAKLAHEKGVTILISSHILSELQLLATKFGFIHKGQFIKEVSVEELLQSAETQICIKTVEIEAAINVLKNDLNIHSITLSESGEILVPKDLTDLEQLMSTLIKQGIPLEGINLSTTNLEHYYMDLIGE
ncbi:ABC transporter ATP-binding protein [Paenibacillus sp. G2S3]|uniref:ABC transporter ATP-binding protein n=1 Tax=Paenibacillus sp. G2S3 TaxID=3047872 RepID=UPI0024C19C00|nr:ABC transporter ATP-binding protein [Paenibacillus sp. G2S3]WHY17709.1 ABC transporter ATP-binding protein [Paenibacillus sp. G2S3]